MCVYDKRRVKEDEEDATRRKRTANKKKNKSKEEKTEEDEDWKKNHDKVVSFLCLEGRQILRSSRGNPLFCFSFS